MNFSIYDATIPVYKQGLATLLHLLDKAEEHASTNGVDVSELINGKLAPDMFDFKQQIQLSSDFAKGGAMRLSGQEVPSHPDTETTVAELRTRIHAALAIVNSVTVEQFAGAEDRDIKMVFPSKTYIPSQVASVSKDVNVTVTCCPVIKGQIVTVESSSLA